MSKRFNQKTIGNFFEPNAKYSARDAATNVRPNANGNIPEVDLDMDMDRPTPTDSGADPSASSAPVTNS